MKENYFNTIDTKDKAYWLGVLYAEAYMETRNQKPYRLGIEIGTKDEIIIDRFIKALDFNPNIKHYRERDNTVIVKFVNKTIVKDLVKWGVVPRKSKIIELPNLSKRDLYLAFLLGFYDGDGKTGTTRIVTGSKTFLEQIKKLFNLPYKIYEKNSQSLEKNKLVISHGYSMSLGVGLFKEMLENYHQSLPRKRHMLTQQEILIKIRNSKDNLKKRKVNITKEELENLVWKFPLYKIGLMYNVRDTAIKYWCIKWGITTPPKGYWKKKRVAQKEKSIKRKEKNKSEEKPVESEKEEKNEEKNENAEIQKETSEDVYEELSQKTPEEEKEEIEDSTRDNQASDDSKEKNREFITENKQEHPFDSRFNKVEEEEDFNDPYLWISPKVRENVEENKEKLLEKVRERSVRYTDSLSEKESLNYSEKDDLETEPKNSFIKESSKENLFENQPLINPEIGIEPADYMQHQKEPLPDMGKNYIPEQPIEEPITESIEEPIEEPITEPIEEPIEEPITEPIEEPIEEPITEPIEEPIEEPITEPIEEPITEPIEEPIEEPITEPIEEPIEEPITEPIEEPIEEPITEPIEEPIEEPITDPIEEPIEEPVTEPIEEPIGGETPIEEIIGAISDITVLHSSYQSSNFELQNPDEIINYDEDLDNSFDGRIRDFNDKFDDDIEKIGNEESYEAEKLEDLVENHDFIDEDDDFNGIFDDIKPDILDSNEIDDIYNSPDDPINFIDIGEYVPEAEAGSSYGYSDCPDDCPSE